MIGEFRVLAQRGRPYGFLLWAAGEIFVVVAGVLIAFGLNAWWAERSARIEEQTHLRSLMRDFELNVGVFDEIMNRAQRSADASLELLQLARNQPDADPARVRALLGPVFSSYRKKPVLDAYEALVSSVGLTLIRDEKLRAALAGFADRATEPYQEQFADRIYLEFTTRYLGRMQLAAAVARDATPLESFAELLNDPAFQEHLAYRYVLESDVAGLYADRVSEARDISARIRGQLQEPWPYAMELDDSSE
jgi:hypothetical protein